jgi:hypothetical protein
MRATLYAGFVLAMTACNTGEKPMVSEISPAQDTPTAAPEKEAPVAPMDMKTQIEFSRKDLAQRLGIELDSVTLSGANPVNWRTGALGCPEPGMNYTQALAPGVLIYLRVGNEAYGYHAKPGGKPFYCPRERAEKPVFETGADVT